MSARADGDGKVSFDEFLYGGSSVSRLTRSWTIVSRPACRRIIAAEASLETERAGTACLDSVERSNGRTTKSGASSWGCHTTQASCGKKDRPMREARTGVVESEGHSSDGAPARAGEARSGKPSETRRPGRRHGDGAPGGW